MLRGRPRQHAAGAGVPPTRPRRASNRPQVPFACKLVLNQWLLSLFNVKRFEEAAGIDAELFKKDGHGLFSGQAVEILEVTRLRDEMDDRTIAIDAFEGNNLLLVDEGHHGAVSQRSVTFRSLCPNSSLKANSRQRSPRTFWTSQLSSKSGKTLS